MMQKRLVIKITAVSAVLAAAGGATFLATASGGPPPGPNPIAFAPTGAPSGSGDPPTVLSAALRQVPGTSIASANITAPPPGAANPNLPWLHVTVHVPSLSDGLDVKPMWLADLIQGEVAEGVGTAPDLHDGLEGSTFDAVLPDGSIVPDESGGMGDIARGQIFSKASTSSIESKLAGTLHEFGLTPVSINVVEVPDAAPEVVAIALDPTKATEDLASIERSLFGTSYQGYFLELQDQSGNAFVRASAAFRTGAGRLWIDPRYASVSSEKTLGRVAHDSQGAR